MFYVVYLLYRQFTNLPAFSGTNDYIDRTTLIMIELAKKTSTSYYQKFRNSQLRHTIWPIRSFELFKFTPMALLMFTILINQNIIRSLKDSLVHTLVGTEVISFIKLWGEMPLGILFVIVYAKLCNIMSTEKAFRVIVIFFLSFYVLFAFVLYPYNSYFHPSEETVAHYISLFPHLKWFIIMWGKWSYILIYIMGELWPMIIFSLLFWQLANKITKIEEASRFYPFFSIFGQANCLVAGSIIIYFSSNKHLLSPLFSHLRDNTEIMIKSNIIIVVISGIISLIIHRHIDLKIIKDSKITSKTEKEVLKLGFLDSLKMIAKSRYLKLMSVLLISYSFSIHLIEGLYMFKARQLFPTADMLMSFQGQVLFWTGIMTIFSALIGTMIIKRLGWIWGAIITPLIMLITGGLFFLAVLYQEHLGIIENLFSMTPLMLIVFLGALQLIFTKGLKYSLFDATKEMAYIPLSDEQKTKGKAAVDIVGGKIGKSAGSIIQVSMFTIFPFITFDDIAFVLMVTFILVCLAWVYGVKALSDMFNKKTS